MKFDVPSGAAERSLYVHSFLFFGIGVETYQPLSVCLLCYIFPVVFLGVKFWCEAEGRTVPALDWKMPEYSF